MMGFVILVWYFREAVYFDWTEYFGTGHHVQ